MIRKDFPAKLCRLCGQESSGCVSVYSAIAEREGLLTKINNHIPKDVIHITAGDGLPKCVCSDCEAMVNMFSEFCNMVQDVQRKLRESYVYVQSLNGKTGPPMDIASVFPSKSIMGHNKDSIACKIVDVEKDSPTVTITPDRKVQCILCLVFMEAVEHTTLHMVTHGIGTILCICAVCKTKKELSEFVRKNKDVTSVYCEVCQSSSTKNKSTHTKAKISGNQKTKSFTCNVCSKAFRSRCHVLRHQIIHTGAKPFLCEVCGVGFNQKSSLKLHIFSHVGVHPYACDKCGQAFRMKVSLRSHVLNVHAPQKYNDCIECQKSVSVCLAHQNAMQGQGAKHTCDRCGKNFATKYKFQRHYRLHTGTRPYKCDTCGRTFSQSGNYNRHRKKHIYESDNTACPDLTTAKASIPIETTTEYKEQSINTISKGHLTTSLMIKPTEQYDVSLLTQSTPPDETVSNTYVPEDALGQSSKFLETILQSQHSVVPCSEIGSASLSMDSVLLTPQVDKGANGVDEFVGIDQSFSDHNSVVPQFVAESAKSLNKSQPQLFDHFNSDSLMYINHQSELHQVPRPQGVTLPTFSSLQSAAPTSLSLMPQ